MTEYTLETSREDFEDAIDELTKQLEKVSKAKGKPFNDVVEEFDHWIQKAQQDEISDNVNETVLVDAYQHCVKYFLALEFEEFANNRQPQEIRMGDLYMIGDKEEIDDKIFEYITKGDG